MKYLKSAILIFCTLIISCPVFAIEKPEPVESTKLVSLKGTWYLRTDEACKEIKLNRKGRSDQSLFQRDVFVDKKPDSLYMTVRQYFNTYTYRMLPIEWGKSYSLELLAVAPNMPPKGKTKSPLEENYTGIFRNMVDCQLGPFYNDASSYAE